MQAEYGKRKRYGGVVKYNPYTKRSVRRRIITSNKSGDSHKGELKWLDTDFASAATGTSGTATSISTMAAGAGKNVRIGDEITIKSARIKGFIKDVTAESIVRILICQGNTGNVVSNILPNSLLEDLPNLAQRTDYHILCDETFSVGVQSVTTTAMPQSGFPGLVPFDLFKKFPKGLVARYAADTSGMPIKNCLFVIAICGVSGTQGAPILVAKTRIRFVDN